MNKIHRYLPLAKVSPGMQLADDLLDKQGHMLLPAHTELSAAMLTSIGHHGIHQLAILVDGINPEEQQAEREHKLARLSQLFRLTMEQEPNSQLYQFILRYRKESQS